MANCSACGDAGGRFPTRTRESPDRTQLLCASCKRKFWVEFNLFRQKEWQKGMYRTVTEPEES